MNFFEAWEECKKGNGIRRKRWLDKSFYLTDKMIIYDLFSPYQELESMVRNLTANDWVVEYK